MQNNERPSTTTTMTMGQVRNSQDVMDSIMRPREGDVITKTGLRRTLKLRSNSRSKSKSPQLEKKGKLTQERRRQIFIKIAEKGKTILEQKRRVNAMLKKLAEKKLAEKMQKDLEETGKLSSTNSAKMEKAVELEKEMKKTPVQQVDPEDAKTYTQLLSEVASSAGGALASAGSGAFQLLKKHGPGVASALGKGLKNVAEGTVVVLGAIAEAVSESAAEQQSVRSPPKVLKLKQKQRTAPAPEPDFDPTQYEPPGDDSPPSSRSSSRNSSRSASSAFAAAPSQEASSNAVAAQPRLRQRENADNKMLRQGMAMGFEAGPGHEGRLRGQVFKPNAKGGKSQKKNKKNKRGTMKRYFY